MFLFVVALSGCYLTPFVFHLAEAQESEATTNTSARASRYPAGVPQTATKNMKEFIDGAKAKVAAIFALYRLYMKSYKLVAEKCLTVFHAIFFNLLDKKIYKFGIAKYASKESRCQRFNRLLNHHAHNNPVNQKVIKVFLLFMVAFTSIYDISLYCQNRYIVIYVFSNFFSFNILVLLQMVGLANIFLFYCSNIM